MTTLYLIKLYDSFRPADQASLEAMEAMKPGQTYKGELTRPRNYEFHKKFFALIGAAYEAWEMPVNEYKGAQIEKNLDRFRKDLLIMAGYGYPVVNIKGDVRYEAKSMSFGGMDQVEFEALYSRVVDVILQKVLTHYTKDDLQRVVNEILGFS
ncbi:MAG: DUF1367 family protein [Methylobacter sp.]|jgi:hypothetical protein|nr:DUF1367 family protein [Methylobacter sp.]